MTERKIHKFPDLKLSARTLKGLAGSGYTKPTDIQTLVIPRAIAGADVVASAKTGSGKTLAFVVPALELLHRENWCRELGLGVLVVSPTRELAYQIFREFRRVGAKHQFSLGLITGGYHDVREQGSRVGRMNILVATPGRIVQHLSERPDLCTDNLRLLVLDEADRILHLGFKAELDALLEYLPSERQTLLFSATQTRSLQDLVRLKMHEPDTVDASKEAVTATPEGLRQAFVRCQSPGDKPRFLWQFITGNRQRKSIVFFATCKQVRFYNELMMKLRPGIRVLQLHGGMTQRRRTAVYDEFGRVKRAVLLCTDLAARGLDFPDVDCVLQLDCPPDLRTYVHRVGRTARLSRAGRAVVLLADWEADTLPPLLAAMRPPVQLEVARPRLPVKWDILGKVAGLVAADPDLRAMAERAVRSYVKAYACFAELKQVFQADRLDLVELSKSHGLAGVPRMPRSVLARGVRPPPRGSGLGEDDDDYDDDEIAAASGEGEGEGEVEVEVEEDDGAVDFLVPKAADVEDQAVPGHRATAKIGKATRRVVADRDDGDCDGEDAAAAAVEEGTRRPSSGKKALTKARLAKRILAKGIRPYRRVAFDEDTGEAVVDPRAPPPLDDDDGAIGDGLLAIDDAKRQLAAADLVDKRLHKELIRRRHRDAKAKARERRAEAAAVASANPKFGAPSAAKRARLSAEAAGDDDGDEYEDENAVGEDEDEDADEDEDEDS